MDEYDTPLQEAYQNGYFDQAIGIIRGFFRATFKTNKALDRALITGITRVNQESLISDFNIPYVCSVLTGGFEKTFGFTGYEMEKILQEYGIEDKRDEIRRWYDGFTIGKETGIYNPWSISCFLDDLMRSRDNQPQPYWAHSGGTALIERLVRFGNKALLASFQQLLAGNEIHARMESGTDFPPLEKSNSESLGLLLAAGYLKPVHHEGEEDTYVLTNHEVDVCFSEMADNWYCETGKNVVNEFARAMIRDDLNEMNRFMQEIVDVSISSFDTM